MVSNLVNASISNHDYLDYFLCFCTNVKRFYEKKTVIICQDESAQEFPVHLFL